MLEDEFGDIISKARSGQNLSLEEVSRQTNIPLDLLHHLEMCQEEPKDEQVGSLARVLNLHAAKLLAIARGHYSPALLDWSRLPMVAAIQGYIGNYPVHAYLLACPETRRVAAIDTGNAPDRVVQAARERGWAIDSILVTHTHVDHIGGIAGLRSARGARMVVHRDERAALDFLWDADKDLEVGEDCAIQVGNMTLQCRHTPGHTAGGITYVGEGVVFVGDTLFAGSAGRANYRYDLLQRSIRDKILTLPEGTVIFPGHGPPSTVGEEKENNPFF